MKANSKIVIAGMLSALLVISCTSGELEQHAETPPETIAQVQTITLEKSVISETLTVYGIVLPWPDKLQTISVP